MQLHEQILAQPDPRDGVQREEQVQRKMLDRVVAEISGMNRLDHGSRSTGLVSTLLTGDSNASCPGRCPCEAPSADCQPDPCKCTGS